VALLPAQMREEVLAELDAEYQLLLEEGCGASTQVTARWWYRSQVVRSLVPALTCRLRALPARLPRRVRVHGGCTDIARDLRVATRSLARTPAFTGLTLLMLAIGIGTTSAAFTVIHAVMLRPLPYADPERIVYVYGSELESENLRQFEDAFTTLTVIAVHGVMDVDVAEGARVFRAVAMPVSEQFFTIMGAAPWAGRPLGVADYVAGAPPVAVITHRFAARQFGVPARALGATLSIDGRSFTVVGVMPSGFTWRRHDRADIWLPIGFTDDRGRSIVARLAAGATRRQVRAEAVRVARLIEGEARTPSQDALVDVQLLSDSVVAFSRGRLQVLVVVVVCVFLVACGNVANLFFARNAGRMRELSVRRALGATRLQLARLILLEGLTLAAVAALLGTFMGIWVTRVLLTVQPRPLPGVQFVSLDARAFGFAAAVAMVSVLLFGALPALALPQGEWGSRGTASADPLAARRMRSALVVGQVVLSTVLFIAAALFVRSYDLLRPADPGFETRDRLALRVELPADGYADAHARERFFKRLFRELSELPGVVSVSASSHVPLTQDHLSVVLKGFNVNNGGQRVLLRAATPNYIDAMEMRLVRGRGIRESDRAGATPIAIINEAMAAWAWRGADPIGRRFTLHSPLRGDITVEVVGVVADAWLSARRGGSRPEVFVPFAQELVRELTIVLQAPNPRRLAASAMDVVHRLEPRVPVIGPNGEFDGPRTLDDVIAEALAPWRYQAALVGIFAGIAVLLTLGGLHGILAFDVSRRSHDMAVRLALGARPTALVREVLAVGMHLVGSGLVLGVLVAFAAHRALSSFVFVVSPLDPGSYGTATLAILLLCSCACWVPAVRAARLDPLAILRHQ
jgi:putative ABC transport system permease protein